MKQGENDWNTVNERVPRPLHDLPKNQIDAGAVFWAATRDVMTKADLMASSDWSNAPENQIEWGRFPRNESEPLWLRPYLASSVPEGPARFRTGMMFLWSLTEAVEYIGYIEEHGVSVRLWTTEDNETIAIGSELSTTGEYRGMAGTNIITTEDLMTKPRLMYTVTKPSQITVRYSSTAPMAIPRMTSQEDDIPPPKWVTELNDLLKSLGYDGAITIYTDGSYKLKEGKPDTICDLVEDTNAESAGGMVIAMTVDPWRSKAGSGGARQGRRRNQSGQCIPTRATNANVSHCASELLGASDNRSVRQPIIPECN